MYSNIDNLIESILSVGKGMVKSGTDVRKVEDSIKRMFNSYGIVMEDVFVSNTVAIVTIRDKNNKSYTQIMRIYKTNTDLARYEEFNDLSRRIVSDKLSPKDIKKEVKEINNKTYNSNLLNIIGYMSGSGFFSIFFGGNFLDGLASSIIGLFVYIMNTYFKKESTNKVIYTLFASIISGSLAFLFVKVNFGNNIDKIIIGDIMLFIPGLGVLNSIKDMFYGDIIAGLFGFIESIIITMAIVAGFAIPSYLFGGVL